MSATAVQVLKVLRDHAKAPVNTNVSQYDLYEYVHGKQDLFGKLTKITSVKIKSNIQIQPTGGKYVVPWALNDQSQECMRCASQFTLFHRRHHCRFCGFLICNECSVDALAIDVLKEAELVSRRCKICRNNNVTVVDTSLESFERTSLSASAATPASAEFTAAPTEATSATTADASFEEKKEVIQAMEAASTSKDAHMSLRPSEIDDETEEDAIGSGNAALQHLGYLGSHSHQVVSEEAVLLQVKQDLQEQEQLDAAATEDEALLTIDESSLAVSLQEMGAAASRRASHRLSQGKPLLQSGTVFSPTIPENNTESGAVATEGEEKETQFFDSPFAGQTPQVNRTMYFDEDKARDLQTTARDLAHDLLQEEVVHLAENTNTNDNNAIENNASDNATTEEDVKEVVLSSSPVNEVEVEGGTDGDAAEEEEEDIRNSTSNNNANISNASSKSNKRGKKNKGKKGK